MIDSYDYFRRAGAAKMPRTPATALHGIEDGVLPPESYIYRATSVKPLFEAPVDLSEIDRVLAYPLIDIETVLFITSILSGLLSLPDKETALFAAESMGAIERRYTERIERLKRRFRKNKEPLACRYVARLYFNLARINGREEAIHRFYLREAFSWLKRLSRLRKLTKKEVVLKLRVLLELGLYSQAESECGRLGKGLKDPDIIYLQGAVQFYKKNYGGVLSHTYAMRKTGYASYYRFWSGSLAGEKS